MKQDEVLQTLRKVIAESDNFTTWTVSTPHLVELVRRAVAAEREECAKVCDDHWKKSIDCGDKAGALQCVGIRTSIRERGNK